LDKRAKWENDGEMTHNKSAIFLSVVLLLSSCSTASHKGSTSRMLSEAGGVHLIVFGEEEKQLDKTVTALEGESLMDFTKRVIQIETTLESKGEADAEYITSMFDLKSEIKGQKSFGWCFKLANQNDATLGASDIRLQTQSTDKLIWYYGWVNKTIVEDRNAKCTPVSPLVNKEFE